MAEKSGDLSAAAGWGTSTDQPSAIRNVVLVGHSGAGDRARRVLKRQTGSSILTGQCLGSGWHSA